MIAAVHKPVSAFRVLSGTTFEAKAPYPLPEGVPAQDLQVVAITGLRAEAIARVRWYRYSHQSSPHIPPSNSWKHALDLKASFNLRVRIKALL